MRILLLAHGFNGLTQRLFCALRDDGHAVSVEFDIADSVTEEAVALWRPDVVIAPYLKRRIPANVWRRVPCLVVHPGPPGDRGPASLDWALLDGAREWGVTVLQANADYDGGPVWAHAGFAMRAAPKSSLYRREVGDAALAAVREALARGSALHDAPAGTLRPGPTPAQRRVDARVQASADWLRHVAAADGHPGAVDADGTWRLFDAQPAGEDSLAAAAGAAPGSWVARRGPALLRRTTDGAVWVGHVRSTDPAAPPLKRPASDALAEVAAGLPEWPLPLQHDRSEPDELRLEVFGPPGARVGWLAFDFHNGAMSTRQCRALRQALREQRALPLQVLVLAGGREFFSNGIHLHDIEHAAHTPGDSAADASMRNIEAMDDVVLEILTTTDRLVVAALQGNAGAGGCFLALAADRVWAHGGVVLNPHYRNMGNLYGSEYWTYTLPRRLGPEAVAGWRSQRLPMGAAEARRRGLVDAVLTPTAAGFETQVRTDALHLAAAQNLPHLIDAKQSQRHQDEAARPLVAYRHDELQRMHRNFYGFDPSYHVARHHFVHRKPMAWTPRHLALHREAR
jgi:putative two-component system hydrogenase maturation factor HypX/HoxX